MEYRSREADAAAIRNWWQGLRSNVSNATQQIGNNIVDGANAIFSRVQGTVTTFINNALPTAIAALGQLSYSGSSGNFQSATERIVLYAKFTGYIWAADSNQIGHIYFNRNKVKNSGGFCVVDNPRVEIPGILMVEEQSIEDFLKAGIYYE